MRTVRTKVYKFEELSEPAKKVAIERQRESETFDYIFYEAWETLTKFAEIFNIKIREWNFMESYRSEYSFGNIDDTIRALSGQRLATYIWNNYRSKIFRGKYYGKLVDTFPDGTKIPVNKEHPAGLRHVKRFSRAILEHSCVLTGVYYDDVLLDPIYNFLDKPRDIDFEDLLKECMSALNNAVQKEVEGQSSDEQVSENLIANEYEFTQDGKIFNR